MKYNPKSKIQNPKLPSPIEFGFFGDYGAHSGFGAVAVSLVAGDDMDGGVIHGLSGGFVDVHAYVEAVWLELFGEDFLDFVCH
jgi:hypothetical protein